MGLVHFLRQPELYGVDPLMTSYRENGLVYPVSAARCTDGFGEALPMADNRFTIAVSLNALDHTLDPAQCVREMSRVLAPGGRLYLWVNVVRPVYAWLRGPANLVDLEHPHHFTAREVRSMIEEAGLRLARAETRIIDERLTLRRALAAGRPKLYLANVTMFTWFGQAVKP